MLHNYLKLAIRLLLRNPFFTFINVLGLSVGFTSFFALWQHSIAELKTDQHHKDFNRIARIGWQWRWDENKENGYLTFAGSRARLLPELKNDFPEIQSYVRILEQAGFFQEDLLDKHRTKMVVRTDPDADGGEKLFNQKRAAYADQNIFEFFTIPLIEGDPTTILSKANSVAVSQSTAIKYFGHESAIGRELSLNDSIPLVVSGVYEDMPVYSRINYDFIISNQGLLGKWEQAYWGGTINFVKLKAGASLQDFEDKINAQVQKYWSDILTDCLGCEITMFAQPLKEVAFSQGLIADEAFYHPSKTILITLGIVSIVILTMAWINYVNLSITRLNNRMKEFATRRANGAMALDLVKQFLVESLLINLLAVGIAITLLQIIRQPLSTLFEIHVPELRSTKIVVWSTFLTVVIAGVLATGLYPAVICILRNRGSVFVRQSNNASKSFITTTLTVCQFTAASVLISWVLIVYLQLNYILNQKIGLEKEGVIIVEGPVVKPDHYYHQIEMFAEQVRNINGIYDATLSRYMVGSDDNNKPGNVTLAGTDISATTNGNGVDQNYIPFFGVNLLAGRNFVNDDRKDIIIISKMAARLLGFDNPEDAIGAKVVAVDGNWQIRKEAEVIGVIEDYRIIPFFNYAATNTVAAEGSFGLFLTYKNELFADFVPEHIAIKVASHSVAETIKQVESLFIKSFPGNTFEWRFLDDQVNQSYAKEKIARNQILMFTVLAMGIACLGLIAMMAQKVVEKTKEIGIRKILGAKAFQIGQMLIHTLLIQLLVATGAGIPVAYYLGSQYLQKYAVQAQIYWWYFLIPFVALLIIMFMAISSMLWKATGANPVEALRTE